MKIKSGIIASGSGSFGGLTLSHNRGGLYLRAKVIPTDPASAQQQAARTAFSTSSSRWATLTDAQREAWTTYALAVPIIDSLGDPLVLTGQQMFVRNNAARLAAGFGFVDDGPVVFSADSLDVVDYVVTGGTGQLGITFTATDAWVDEDDAGLLIYGSRQQSPTINWFRGPYRFAGVIEGDSVTAPTSPDTSLNLPFAIAAGNNAFFRCLSVRADGRISPIQFAGGITALP